MRKKLFMSLMLVTVLGQFAFSATPKRKTTKTTKVKKVSGTESQKMKAEIDRIEKRVSQINQNIEEYKVNEAKLDEMEIKLEQISERIPN